MKTCVLATCILGAIYALDNVGLDQIAPDARGRSVLALNTVSTTQVDLLIYGPIGDYFWADGITAASIVEQLGQVTAGTINVRINSDGGVVSDGLAIFNALAAHPATVSVTIDGVAASIASLIAQVGTTRKVHRNATMMLHGPQSGRWGYADDLRDAAAMLDTITTSMLSGYTARATTPADIEAQLRDRRDHWYTAEQMVAAGLADEIIEANVSPAPSDEAAAAALLSYVQAISTSERSDVTASLRQYIQTTVTASAFAALSGAHQRAVFAHIEDSTMKHQCNLILAQAGNQPSSQGNNPTPAPAVAVAPAPVPTPAPIVATDDPIAQLAARNESIRGVFAAFHDVPGVRELESTCLADPRMTVEQAQARLLQRLPNGATPLAAAPARSGESRVIGDENETRRQRVADGILARAGILTGEAATAARQDNPAAHQPLFVLAEQSLITAGVNTRTMDRDQISRMALAQSTGDFPLILENVLHRMLLTAYRLQQFTWSRFCATGSLTDYRPHNRYHMGSFSDLKPVNEEGEYENGILSDAAKETIQGSRKGRILQITPEVLVNDDLGAFSRPTTFLGQAAARTIEKDVYALLGQNAGMGPLMSDGLTLFHADHGNIATSAGAPTIARIDAGRQQMAQQKDVGGNDYLDILPAIFLGPLSLGSTARELNAQEYNDEAQRQQKKPNVVRGLFADVVDSPRLSGLAWLMLADPNVEPVIEVAFLNGVQTPTLEQEVNFRTDGVSWKVVHRYGVGAVGFRGAHRNAGE
ncbi:ClpP-like prohead protease/major capsid protein fusion protein [Pseudoxanthomonas sp. SE1]|uniref:ClpP-like prohead protease/major capsid protein fusion protein n=1 Tax=Pseudoxanthomonas sp. SE1 TaxID=1664560 RepID=UPI00240DB9F7|nr:ClpP-like prohead protease/major capsid protein fusion protein [Pseudoxanthomonas sp. SE1]WFC43246.1 Clp protease ClpP [Pseudoxanthomonas sp. SE1]